MTEPEAEKAVGAARLFYCHFTQWNMIAYLGLCQGRQGNEYVWET